MSPLERTKHVIQFLASVMYATSELCLNLLILAYIGDKTSLQVHKKYVTSWTCVNMGLKTFCFRRFGMV